MSNASYCAQCGAPLPPNWPKGLCSRCALHGALELSNAESQVLQPDSPQGQVPSEADLMLDRTGAMIGRYKLLQKIGEGGFGVVYMAEQQEPVQRKVALKIIKAGMDTREVIARFEAERQALALMDHPNIARVLDAGATEAGRPYFVMELVRGIPITDFCDQGHLPAADRLKLFMTVCHAVQHAHQKGVIHRDLKPSNVLVTLHDGQPVPKVIDFGVAKALGQKLTEKTLFTAFHHMIGTPAYMSPEQAELSGLDIDTRADIYSLGVLLYELLTGVTPFDAETLRKAALDEIRRMIRETEPLKPSTRLQTLGDKLIEVAKHRQIEPAALSRLVRGDLDWIVMRCLEKDRTRRYETANGLAMDIQRHLQNETVVARPPSNLYRFQKMVRRNQLAFAAAGSVTAALLIGLGVSTLLFFKEREARQRAVVAEQIQTRLRQEADAARQAESKVRAQAEAAEGEAKTEASRSQQVAQFLKDMLEGVGPSVALGRDTTMLREILGNTVQRIRKDLKEQPKIEAELLNTIGTVYRDLDQVAIAEVMHREALSLRRRVFGDEHLSVAASLHELGTDLSIRGEQAEAEKALYDALVMRRRLLGNEHLDVAASLFRLSRIVMMTNRVSGTMSENERRFGEAEVLARDALAMQRKLMGNEHRDVARSLKGLADLLQAQAFRLPPTTREPKLAEAEDLVREAVATQRKLLGNAHPDLAGSLNQLAWILSAEDKFAEAETTHREELALQKKLRGNENPRVAETYRDLVSLLSHQGKLAEAAFALRNQIVSMGTDETSMYMASVSLDYFEKALEQERNYDKAEQFYNDVLPSNVRRDTEGTYLVLLRRAEFLARRGRWRQAAADTTKCLEYSRAADFEYLLCPLLVANGDLDGYRQHCRRMIVRFGDTKSASFAEQMAKGSLILPSAEMDFRTVGAWAEAGLKFGGKPEYLASSQFTKGLAEYRQEHFMSAVEWLKKALKSGESLERADYEVETHMVLAMSHHQLKHMDEARAALVKGLEIADTKLPKLEDGGDLGKDWSDWIIAQALVREAKALIEGQPATEKK